MSATKTPTNKSQAIRDALIASPGAQPAEIAKTLKAQGLKVTPQYVSIVKYNMQKAKRPANRPRMSSVAHRTQSGQAPTGLQEFQDALAFIKAAGGLKQAQAVLGTIEQIAQAI